MSDNATHCAMWDDITKMQAGRKWNQGYELRETANAKYYVPDFIAPMVWLSKKETFCGDAIP